LYCLIGIAVLPVVWLYGPKLTLAILPAEVEQLEAVNALEVDSTHKSGLVEIPSAESYLTKPTDVEMSAPNNVEEGKPFPMNIVLAALWLTGTILMLARLCVGWYRLRRICLSATPLSQDNRFGNMDGRKLKILVTSQIKGPVCFGVLRPIIMLPRRMYENGTTEGLRMIISHELAHIERRDCWANLYQRLVEAVFFFHPLVWWAQGSSVTDYTALLAQIGEQGLARTQLRTVALFEGRLLQRVRNLLDPRRSRKTKPSRWATMVCTVGILICFGMLGTVRLAAKPTVDSLSAPVESEASAEEKGNLNIFDIKFEPIHQGKNVVKVNIQNTSNKEQTFAIHIYTRSVDYAPGGVGWGTRFFDTIKAKETKWSRFVFKIQGPVTDNTWLRLKFYNPESEEAYDYEKPFQQRRYESSDLERREVTPEKSKPPHYPETDNVITAFRQIQDYISTRNYEEAWQLFTKDYKEAEFQTRGLEAFKKAMEPTHPLHSAFVWEKDDFLNLKPTEHVTKKDNVLTLHAKSEKQHWKIAFVQEDGRWKIDWIAGYRPAILDTIEADAAKVVDGKAKSELELLDVKFEPIRQGKNVVRVKVQNNSEQEQVFRLQIYTRSPDYGRKGVGWGTSFFDTIKPKEAKWTRFVFKIHGPLTDATYVRLDFHNPGPAAGFDREKYFEDKGPKKWFKRVKYSSSDIEHYKADETLTKPASKSDSEAITQAFKNIQKYMTDKKYEQVWELFTKDYQDAEFQSLGFERFKQIMEPDKHPPIVSAFWWEKAQFIRLQPESVVKREAVWVLTAKDEDQTWKIDFAQEDGQWKVDWIAGYTLRILLWQNWEERSLAKMEKRNTEHFDIYYEKGSVAEKQIEKIAKDKEAGYLKICDFLGTKSDVRIRLVLFEDEQKKWFETGHQGRGWAYGNTIVEVYNEQEQLDPYHETTHVLMRPYGDPPALFNEGFAVYMSELLGAHALEDLSGGQATIYQRVRELKNKGEWIDIEELITYTEIGSSESRPPVAYPEAASFVKFLIDKYGRSKFLRTYKNLKNSGDKTVQQKNFRKLKEIYDKSLKELEKEWEKAFSS
jgi:hypothetical protein